MKKMKRYNGEDDSVTSERESDAGVGTDTSSMGPANSAPTNFKSAFAAARTAGDKTFEFGGKKFITELAKPKSVSSPAAETTAAKTETKIETKPEAPEVSKSKPAKSTRDDMMAARRERTIDAVKSVGSGIGSMFNRAVENYKSTVPRYKEKNMAKGGMASSASSRADGCCVKGKTRGKMM